VGSVTAACGSGNGSGSAAKPETLTLYNGQHEEITNALIAAFQKKTGIVVHTRNGEGPELANQILAEGSASPADIVFTENSPEITLLADKGRLAKVDAGTLAKVPANYTAPQGQWLAFARRATALAYDPRQLTGSQLPKSLLDVAQPKWRGKIGVAPAEGDFQPLVTTISVLKGDGAAKDWVAGLKRNIQTFQNNTAILNAVNSGQISIGLINQHYWFRLRDSIGAGALRAKLYYFGHQDPGALVNVSGVGVLAGSKHMKAAQQFLAFLVSPEGQQLIVTSKDYEYPIVAGVAGDPQLKPFDTLDPPAVTVGQLNDGTHSVDLLRQAGLL
jgi:iron(III) transport system substrate-binding protein